MYVNDCLDRNRLSYGKYTREFEQKFANMHGCKHGIFLNSGTSALQVALAALKEIHGYQDGDEVLVPACTFIATSNVVIQNGLCPVFVDVDPHTYNIDCGKLFDAWTPRTRCIIPVHLFGLPADMKFIKGFADANGLQILEDSCETVGATQNGQVVGSFGDAACFSTYVNHLVTGGVGGLITTNNDQLAEISRSLMAHGRDSIYTNIDMDDSDDLDLRRQMIERRLKFDRLGFSYRATEMEAAIALSELERVDNNIRQRQANADYLTDFLHRLGLPFQLPYVPVGMTHSYMMYPIVCDDGVDREPLLMYLEKHGIETRLLFPLLENPIYRKLFPLEAEKHTMAQRLAKQGFFIGCHQGLDLEDMRDIVVAMQAYFLGYQ
jgi:CDP-6-deoxy-D-xylo-4-hexulose-3-dehydrase